MESQHIFNGDMTEYSPHWGPPVVGLGTNELISQ